MSGRSIYLVLPDDTPDPCPNACGRLTEDPYGGPCKQCWAQVGGPDDNHDLPTTFDTIIAEQDPQP